MEDGRGVKNGIFYVIIWGKHNRKAYNVLNIPTQFDKTIYEFASFHHNWMDGWQDVLLRIDVGVMTFIRIKLYVSTIGQSVFMDESSGFGR